MSRKLVLRMIIMSMHNKHHINNDPPTSPYSLSWALFSSVTCAAVYMQLGGDAYRVVAVVGVALLAAFYLVLWILPQKYLHRRPAMVNYAFWNVLVLGFYELVLLVIYDDSAYNLTSCAVETIFGLCWFCQPFILLQVCRLQRDIVLYHCYTICLRELVRKL